MVRIRRRNYLWRLIITTVVGACFGLVVLSWKVLERDTSPSTTLEREVASYSPATTFDRDSPVADRPTQNLQQQHPLSIDNQSVSALVERVFHVSRRGFAVEGALLVKVADRVVIRHGRRLHIKFFDPRYWKQLKCGRSFKLIEGTCKWCPVHEPSVCKEGGDFIVSQFKDDHRSYSLQAKGTMAMIKMRPATPNNTIGKAEIDTVYAICENLPHIPEGIPGILSVPAMNNFIQMVNPRPPSVKHRRTSAIVCSKAFYGTGINSRTIHEFVHHYVHVWGFNRIYMYELGTTVGILLMDIILASTVLSEYVRQGRIVVIDLRDELQRMYGPIAGDVVLFSSKNGQLLVEGDCFTRAKADSVDWVLQLDWDEILTYGRDVSSIPEPRWSFLQWIRTFSREHLERSENVVRLVYLRRVRATEDSICNNCDGHWDEKATWEYHKEHEAKVNSEIPIEPETKYAVRILNTNYPLSHGYGVHVISKCAFAIKNFTKHVHTIDPGQLYLRHYKCLNKHSVCDKQVRYNVNWGYRFAGFKAPVSTDGKILGRLISNPKLETASNEENQDGDDVKERDEQVDIKDEILSRLTRNPKLETGSKDKTKDEDDVKENKENDDQVDYQPET